MKASFNVSFSTKPFTKTASAVLAYLTYLILFLLFAGLASVVSPELMQPTQTGKFFMFSSAMVCTAILFLIYKILKDDPTAIRLTLIDILLSLLFLYITVNRFLLQETWGFSLRYYELLGLGILYILLRQMDKKIYPWLFIAAIASGIIQAVYGNLQLYGFYPSHHSGFKMTGSFFNPGPYAGFLSVVFSVALGVYLLRRSIFKVPGTKFRVPGLKAHSPSKQASNKKLETFNPKDLLFEYLPLAGVIAILMVLPASRSRAAWLAAGVSGIYLLALKYRWTNRIKIFLNTSAKKFVAALVLGIMTLGIGYGLYLFKPGSADGRLLIWKVTANMVMDSPWIGHGFDRFKAEYMNYQAAYFQNDAGKEGAVFADNVYYAFNEPLQFAAENGTVGLLILAALLLSVFRLKSQENKHLLTVAKAGLLSIIVFSLFSYPMQILPIKLIAVFLMATAATFQNSFFWSSQTTTHSSGSLLVRRLVVGIVLIGMFLAIPATSNLREGYRDWATAFNLYQMGAYAQSLESYEKASTGFAKEGDFLMNYGKALSVAGEHKKAVKILLQAEEYLNTTIIQTALGDSYKGLGGYEEAEEAYFRAWYMAPSRFYPKYLLAKLYDENNQKKKAKKMASEIMEKEVKVESMAIEEITAEMERIIGVVQDNKLK